MKTKVAVLALALLFAFSTVSASELQHPTGARSEIHTPRPAQTAGSAGGGSGTASVAPAQVDLSPNCPPIFNQGALGSCVTCAEGYAIKGYLEKVEHSWDATQASHQFSPSYLYPQVNGGSDGGAYVSDVYNVILRRGCSTLDVQPYTYDYTTWPTQSQCRVAAPYRNALVGGSTYYTLANSDLTGIKNTLSAGTVLGICLYVDSAWDYLGSGTNYVWYPNGQSIRGGHCVTVVGYDDNITDNNGHVGALKIQNSWGAGWASGGYCWIAYAALSNSGVQPGLTYPGDRIGDNSSIQANIQVNHAHRGAVRIDVGVGSTSSPTWSYSFYPRLSLNDMSNANVYTTVDLSDAAAYWPPSTAQKWWVRVTDDTTDSTTGSLVQFTLTNGSTTLNSSTALPLAMPDNGAVYAYVDGSVPIFTSVGVSPVSTTIQVNTTQQFTAAALDQNGVPMASQPTFSWSVSGGGSIDANGLFTAGALDGGPFTITATGGGKSGTASITLVFPPVLTSVAVTPGTATVNTNASQQFTAKAYDQYGSLMSPQPSFTWSVNGGGAISASGLFTAGAVAGGPFTVTATGGGKSGTASITVKAPPVLHISAITMTKSKQPGNKYQAQAQVFVVDQYGSAYPGATVTGTWSGKVTGTSSGTTGANGSVTLASSNSKNIGAYTFTVTKITATSATYSAASNVVTSATISVP